MHQRDSIPGANAYHAWAEHRVRTEAPSADIVAQDCAARGVQCDKPITPAQTAEQTAVLPLIKAVQLGRAG
ncbi:hypothetical protein ABTY98_25435 [Streptomyces sp. NPDC096040]|uniref:hypothetical protein n=1 Tax=Streptomyces sp. NPDC096040 TaxID=3155541 RepID=UPI0033198754